jgi:hypothetical protein
MADAGTEGGREQVLLARERTPALTVLKGRIQRLRHHLPGCDDLAWVHEDREAIAAARARLTTAVARLDRSDSLRLTPLMGYDDRQP